MREKVEKEMRRKEEVGGDLFKMGYVRVKCDDGGGKNDK